jgi:hypothetical protein
LPPSSVENRVGKVSVATWWQVILVQTYDGAVFVDNTIVAGNQKMLGLADGEDLGGHGWKPAGTCRRDRD